ncbi:MAG: hypothetical protein CL470_06475 [Acidimicrobiaceae bacterium]|nr:hypothetical protein [Acidimicrobiaceae bacterium]
MSLWVSILCSTGILGFSISLLYLSGVWSDIFAPRKLRPKETFDPLVTAPFGWIENHVFWDIHGGASNEDGIVSEDFWESDSKRFAS